MEYRYYIYKQSLIPTNFNKYDLSQYDYFCEIVNTSQWSLNIERNSDWFTVIRREFNGSISVTGLDYNALIAIEGDPYQYAIVIHRKCNGVYSEFWKGFFSYFDYKVDMDRCTLSFTPQVWDAYSPVFDQMEIERNVLAASTPQIIFMDGFQWPFERITTTYTYNSPETAAVWHEYDYDPVTYPPGNAYFLYERVTINLGYDDTFGHFHLQVNEEYRRDFALSSSNVTPPPGSPPPGEPNWILDPLLTGGEVSPGVYKWVRPFMNSLYQTYTWGSWDFPHIETLDVVPNEVYNLNGCITLKSVLEFYAQFFNLDYTSNFFNDDPCPMGGQTLELTMLMHLSNLRGVEDVATRGMMKLKDLLIAIRDTFNAYWYIDSNGDFRIEHRRYFDFGLSYAYAVTIELDMSTVYPTNVKNMRRYEWATPELFRFEVLEFPFSFSSDWIDSKIEYNQYSIAGNDTKTITALWGTDIIMMYEDRDNLPEKGWVLLNVNTRGGGVGLNFVTNTIGAITLSGYQNARFSSANILRDLWGYGRLLPSALVNTVESDFITVKKLKQQPELTFPMCCQDIDFNGVFRTPLGDGIIDKAEYEAKSGNLKINLIYE